MRCGRLEFGYFGDLAGVARVREIVERHFEEVLRERKTVSQLGVAAHEMLENGVKYSTDGVFDFCVQVEWAERSARLLVRTRHHAQANHVAAVLEQVESLARATEPTRHYLERLRHTEGRVSQVGLARIASEAQMKISARIQDGVLTVSAESE